MTTPRRGVLATSTRLSSVALRPGPRGPRPELGTQIAEACLEQERSHLRGPAARRGVAVDAVRLAADGARDNRLLACRARRHFGRRPEACDAPQ